MANLPEPPLCEWCGKRETDFICPNCGYNLCTFCAFDNPGLMCGLASCPECDKTFFPKILF